MFVFVSVFMGFWSEPWAECEGSKVEGVSIALVDRMKRKEMEGRSGFRVCIFVLVCILSLGVLVFVKEEGIQ